MSNDTKQPDYNRVELNHIKTMYEEAKVEYPRLEHSVLPALFRWRLEHGLVQP